MTDERSLDELLDEFNAQAKAEGNYDGRAFWEVPPRPGSILDVPETPESHARIASLRERIAELNREARKGSESVQEIPQEPSHPIMKFRNPWIDPRVPQVRSAAAQAYLRTHGWQALPVEQANLLPFTKGSGEDDSPVLQVPVLEQARDYPQRIVEFITDLALAEGRYAVDVLNDILQQAMADAVPTNGPAATGKTEPARK